MKARKGEDVAMLAQTDEAGQRDGTSGRDIGTSRRGKPNGGAASRRDGTSGRDIGTFRPGPPPGRPAADPAATGTYDQLLSAVGIDATAKIVEAHGGRKLYVGIRPSPRIVEMIGAESGAALCDAMSGRAIDVPTKAPRQYRRRDVIEARANGATIAQLAERFGVSERTIFNDLRDDSPAD